MADEIQLQDNQIKLSDGRIVTMRETTGADEAIVAMALGDKVSLQGAGIQVLAQANAIKAIADVNGEPLRKEDGTANRLMSYGDFLNALRQFKSRDMIKIVTKYSELNQEANEDSPLA